MSEERFGDGSFGAAIAVDRNGPERRNASEKLDFVVAFVPFGRERARRDFDSADMVVPIQIRLTVI